MLERALAALGIAGSIIVLAVAALCKPRETRIAWDYTKDAHHIYWCVFCHEPCTADDFCRGCKAVICERCDHKHAAGKHHLPSDHR